MSLNQEELAILRLLSANGMIEEQRLVLLLGQRSSMQGVRPGELLASLEKAGMVESSSGLCWLSGHGKTLLRSSIQDTFKGLREIIELEVWPEFSKLDVELKRTCTMWQLKPDGNQNPHDDPEYDFQVLEKLQDIHEHLLHLINGKETIQENCSGLLADMDIAMERIGNGDFDFVVGLGVNSYHSLWRELHEHLLNALGLERTE